MTSEPPRPDPSNGDAGDFELFSSLRYDPCLLQNTPNTELSGHPGQPSPFYMLRYHRDRLLSASEHFEWRLTSARLEGEQGLRRLEEDLDTEVEKWLSENGNGSGSGAQRQGQALKLRTLFNKSGGLRVEITPTSPVSLENLYPSTLLRPSQHQHADNDDKSSSKPQQANSYRIHVDPSPTLPTPFTKFKTTSRVMYVASRARASIHSMNEPAEVVLANPSGQLMEGSLTSVYFFRDGRWTTPSVVSGGQEGTTRRWLLARGFCVEGVVNVDSVVDGEGAWISNGVRGLTWGRVVAL